jgi:membrane-associated protease RseP (regulator of RpoE activity)
MKLAKALLLMAALLGLTGMTLAQEKAKPTQTQPVQNDPQRSFVYLAAQDLAVQGQAAKPEEKQGRAELHYYLGQPQVLEQSQVAFEFKAAPNDLAVWTGAFGVNVEPVTGALQHQLKLKATDAILINALSDESLAKQVDLQQYDVIVGLGDKPDPQKPLKVRLYRAGAEQERTLKAPAPKKQYWIGVHMQPVEEPLRTQLSLPEGKGLILNEVIAESPAKKAGLQTYDVVVGIEKLDFAKTEELAEQVQLSEGKPMTFRLIRHAKPLTLAVVPIVRPLENTVTVLNNGEQVRYARLLLSRQLDHRVNANALTARIALDLAKANPTDPQQQIASLQAELAKLNASTAAIQEQLQKLSEQLKK